MAQRKRGYALDIPFVDSSCGVMANGVPVGRPATPPVITISIPDLAGKRASENGKKKNTQSDKRNSDGDDKKSEGESQPDSVKVVEIDAEDGEHPKELKPSDSTQIVRRHRRNSISLPAGLDAIEMVMSEDTNGETDETFSDADESEYNTDAEETKAPLRNDRKKSVMPPKSAMSDSEFLELPEVSMDNSITSINSISSLLKEKLSMMALPNLLKAKRKPKNYKLKAFVAFLLMCIIFLVSFAYVYYHQQVLQRAYFEMIRFNNMEKIVKVFDNEGQELLSGHLGTTLHSDLVFKCLSQDIYDDGSVCMEWMHRARLYLNYRTPDPDVRCYQITWMSLNPGVNPTDCYDWDGDEHWYGGGQAQNMSWPAELGTVKFAPFITGDVTVHQWGNVLQRYFLNSKGVAISIDAETPLYISIDNNGFKNKQFCVQAKHDDFSYYYKRTLLPQLNYSICTSNNIKILHGYLSEKSLWDGLKEQDVEVVNSLLTEPVWQIGPNSSDLLTESAVYNYTEDVIALGFLRQGHVLLNEFWQTNIGDFAVDTSRFPTMEQTIKILQRRGFKIVFSIQPFISTDSVNFKTAVEQHLLVSERGSSSIPALTRYKSVASAGVLDITNNRTIPWLTSKLKAVVARYQVNSFYLDLGTAYNMPSFYRFEKTLMNPDEYKTLFTEALQEHLEVVAVSSAVKRPRPPVFVSLPPMSSTWESLQHIIPTVLTYGIIGYPFIMPGPVGGDFYTESTITNYTHIYMKSVENALLKKSIETYINNKKVIENKMNIKPFEPTEKTVNETEVEEVVEEVEPQVVERSDVENETNVFSTNYENFFNKDLNLSVATDILKNIGASNMSDILDKATIEYPGDIMQGDEIPPFSFLPDRELYTRWLQVSTFLPVIRFTYLPSKYKDERVLEMAKILTALRIKTVNPLLKKYAKEALDSGLPIIRPLWMLDPSDPACHTVVDEFSVGEELIVAPIIHESSVEREVYLPSGVWKDGIDGSLRKGNRWIHKYRVPLDKIAYFVKMPDNTRF